MLGRIRRTTRTDVGLALTMAGLIYLAWVLATYVAKGAAGQLAALAGESAPEAGWLTRGLMAVFTGAPAALIDLIGPLWLLASLWMVVRASLQRRIISWSWLISGLQAIAAILIGVWAAHARGLVLQQIAHVPVEPATLTVGPVDWSPTVVAAAVVLWGGALIWLVLLAARYARGPVQRDGLKTQLSRR